MKRLLPLALLLALPFSSALAGGEGWLIDFEAAKKKAAAEKKDLLVDFTGSDWCGYCIKLSEEVFSKEAFPKGVADSFVLVELDFPNDKSKLSDETHAQNEKLSERYHIEGFPSILLMDAEGRPYARTGYRPGGPETYLTHLNELRKVRTTRDEGFAAASSAEGVAKAKVLSGVLEKLPPEDVDAFYEDTIKEIIANDPKDETGFAAARAYKKAVADFEETVEGFFGAGEFAKALEAAEAFLAEHKPTGVDKQHVLMTKVMVHVEERDEAAAHKQLDEIKALAPDSEVGGKVERMKTEITEYLSQKEGVEEGSGE